MNYNEDKKKDLVNTLDLNDEKEFEKGNINEISNENKEKSIDNKNLNEEKEKNISIKDNETKSNDNPENNKNMQKNEVIEQFLKQMEKNKEENKENIKQNNKEDEKSDDPFLKAEKEYRIKNNKIEDKKIKKEKNKKKGSTHNLRYKTENGEDGEKPILNNKSKSKDLMQDKIFNHFKKGINRKKAETNYNFKPKIFKNPEKLYFKAIIEEKINYLRMRSYDRRTGIFDFKKFNSSKYDFFKKNKIKDNYNNNNFNTTKTSFHSTRQETNTINNNYFKYINNNDKQNIKNNNKLNKRNLTINNESFLSTLNNKKINNNTNEDPNFFYTSITNNNPKTETNNKINNYTTQKEETLSSKSQKETIKNNSANKIKVNKNKNKNKKMIINSANNNKISTEKMRAYLLEYHKNKIKYNNRIFSKSNSHYKNRSKNSLNNFIYSIDDPENPYSINFLRNILKNNYNLDINYKIFGKGIPLLTIKQAKKRRFNFGFFNGDIKPKERMVKTSYDNYPSGFKTFKSNKNENKSNNRYQFSMTQTGNNFYRKKH